MAITEVHLTGKLWGRCLNPARGSIVADIVHVEHLHESAGPAENAFVLIELNHAPPRARYISWINYFDIEYADRRQRGRWALVEPAESYERTVTWLPFGWPGAIGVPTIGDAILDEMKAS